MLKTFLKEEKAQAAAEYLLLVGIGVMLVAAAAALSTQLRRYTDWASSTVKVERDALISILE